MIQVEREKISLLMGRLEGPILRLQVSGWLKQDRQASLALEGTLARVLLEGLGMHLIKAANTSEEIMTWEPFKLDLNGSLSNPSYSFVSRSFSYSQTPSYSYGERKL